MSVAGTPANTKICSDPKWDFAELSAVHRGSTMDCWDVSVLTGHFCFTFRQNEVLWREVVSLRQNHSQQQKVINKVVIIQTKTHVDCTVCVLLWFFLYHHLLHTDTTVCVFSYLSNCMMFLRVPWAMVINNAWSNFCSKIFISLPGHAVMLEVTLSFKSWAGEHSPHWLPRVTLFVLVVLALTALYNTILVLVVLMPSGFSSLSC